MWWHILGVEQKVDLKTIKRVYAKRLRDLDQDRDIDAFTKVNEAYKQAVQSFNTEKLQWSAVSIVADGYLSELHHLYHSEKRIQPQAWINQFNCMSFAEEADFDKRCISFFNDHYELTDEVWQVIRTRYPIMEHKEFKWKELCSEHFACSLKEVDGLPWNKAASYIKDKIQLFFYIYHMEYDKAVVNCHLFIEKYGDNRDVLLYLQLAEKYMRERVEYPAWLDLEDLSPKEIKFLSQGKYHRVLGKDSQLSKRSLFGLVR